MSKKLLVIVIAIVLAASIVGASFALYVKTDSKNVTIGYDSDAVSLGLSTNAASLTLNNLSPENPSKIITISLSKSGATPAASMKGFFKIDIANVGGGDLASAITASAVVTHKDTTTTDLNQAQLTGTGYTCLLSDLPESIALTIALDTTAEGFNFANYAEEAITISMYWTPYDNTAYYLRSADTNWLPDPTMVLVANPNNVNEVMITGVTLAANQEFKFTHNGDWYGEAKPNDGESINAALYNSTTSNLYVAEAGTYSFYYDTTNNKVWAVKE